MNTSPILTYLAERTANNNAEWSKDHTTEFQAANECFTQLAIQLNLNIRKFDPSIPILRPRDMIYEFEEASATLPSFRAYIAPEGMRSIPTGYFLCLRAGNRSLLSGGLHSCIFDTAANMVRDRILDDPWEWDHLLSAPAFQEHFVVLGDRLNHFPHGYDANHFMAHYFQQNNWYVKYPIQDATIMVPDALETVATEIFEAMSPFVQYLNRAMRAFRLRA